MFVRVIKTDTDLQQSHVSVAIYYSAMATLCSAHGVSALESSCFLMYTGGC